MRYLTFSFDFSSLLKGLVAGDFSFKVRGESMVHCSDHTAEGGTVQFVVPRFCEVNYMTPISGLRFRLPHCFSCLVEKCETEQ